VTREEEFAQACKTLAAELAAREPKDFDFSPESLHAAQAALDGDRELARAVGAYLAEVVMKRSPVKLRWVSGSVLPGGAAGPENPFVLATPKNVVFAVLGKPQRLVSGETLKQFADKIQDLCSREATSLG
jgi:hypothetical protein